MIKLSKEKGSLITRSNKPQKWSKSITIGDTTEEINVEEISNGFIVSYFKSWYDKNKGYQSINKKGYSKENPLSDEYLESENKKALKDLFNDMLEE